MNAYIYIFKDICVSKPRYIHDMYIEIEYTNTKTSSWNQNIHILIIVNVHTGLSCQTVERHLTFMKICSSKIRFVCSKNDGGNRFPLHFHHCSCCFCGLRLSAKQNSPNYFENQAPKTWNFLATFRTAQKTLFSRIVTGLPDSPPPTGGPTWPQWRFHRVFP